MAPDKKRKPPVPPVRQGPIPSSSSSTPSSSGILGWPSQRGGADYLFALLTRAPVWSVLGKLLSPFWRVLSIYWYIGGSMKKVMVSLRRMVLRLAGQLYAPCTGSAFRHMSYNLWVIRRWHVAAAAAVGATLVQRGVQRWLDARSPVEREKRRLAKLLTSCASYQDWSKAAGALDELDMSTMPRKRLEELRRQEARLYDARLLETHRAHLEHVRTTGDIYSMMFSLRADLIRNLGNMTSSKLHERCAVVPGPIRRYIDEVNACLRTITTYEGPELAPEEKLSFLRETRHAFGRTALVLSGGGALGAFHLGVIKALLNEGHLPRVLAGSSVGSIISSLIATRTDDELRELFEHTEQLDLSFFSNNSPGQLFTHLVTSGTLQDISVLQHRLKCLIGDLTFQEAYERTGRILNVSVCAADTNEPPRLLNYLTAPHALIWSAVAASSAFPLLFKPSELLGRNSRGEVVPYIAEKNSGAAPTEDGASGSGSGDGAAAPKQGTRRWFDGSLEQDLPMRGLSEMFNVNYFLVSQANPHVIPLLYMKSKINSTLADVLETEWKHRCGQLEMILPDWISKKVFRLLNQTWEGDITVSLPYEYCDVGKAITNPTQQSLMEAIQAGQRCTWAKLAAVECNCGIEVTLDQCLGAVVAAQRQRRRDLAARGLGSPMAYIAGGGKAMERGMRQPADLGTKPVGRIPSWLMMSSLGGQLAQPKSRGGSSDNLECLQCCDEPPTPPSGQENNSREDETGADQQQTGAPGSPRSYAVAGSPSKALGKQSRNPSWSSTASNPALGLPCGSGGLLLADFPIIDPASARGHAPFGSFSTAQEFWKGLFPVAQCAWQMDGSQAGVSESLDFIAP